MSQRSHRTLLLDLAFAACLISLEIAVVIFWFLGLFLAVNHALEPWNDAGIVMLGPGFILLAAMFGLPGAAWARSLSEEFALPWSRRALVTARIGSLTLALGVVVALIALIAAFA